MSTKWIERLALIAILVLAAYLRLNHLGWAEFKLDEANLSRLSLNLVRGIEFPLTGIGSSAGIVNPPLAAWLLALPYAVSPSPIVATGFVALLNVIAVAACYGLTRRWLGSAPVWAALLATLLFAAAPWAVIYSRKIWAQNLLMPLVIVWAWTGWLAFARRRPRALIGHALALAACIQLHYSAMWLIPVTLIWSIAFARRVQWKSALAATAIFALTFAPVLIADALRGGQSINRVLDLAKQPAAIDDQALHMTWLMITGQEIHSLAGPQEFENFLAGVPNAEALAVAEGILVGAGALLALMEAAGAARSRVLDDRAAASFMMVSWLSLPVLIQSRHSLPIYPHYFIILYPVPFMLVGLLYARLSAVAPALLSRVGQPVLIGFAVVTAALQSVQTIALQEFVATRATPGGYGVPVAMLEQIASEAASANRDLSGAEVLVYTEGDNPTTHEGPAIFDILLPPNIPRRFVDLTGAVEVYPRGAAVIIWYSPRASPLPGAVAGRAPLYRQDAVVPLRTGEAASQIRIWPSQSAASIPCASGAPLGTWQNGVTLLEARPSGDWRGSTGSIELCYRIDTEHGGAEYHWFNHVIGPDDRRWAQVDGAGYPTASWRSGDVIRVYFRPLVLPSDAPRGPYTVRIGMYTYPQVVEVPLVDAAGHPVGSSVAVYLGNLIQ